MLGSWKRHGVYSLKKGVKFKKISGIFGQDSKIFNLIQKVDAEFFK